MLMGCFDVVVFFYDKSYCNCSIRGASSQGRPNGVRSYSIEPSTTILIVKLAESLSTDAPEIPRPDTDHSIYMQRFNHFTQSSLWQRRSIT